MNFGISPRERLLQTQLNRKTKKELITLALDWGFDYRGDDTVQKADIIVEVASAILREDERASGEQR